MNKYFGRQARGYGNLLAAQQTASRQRPPRTQRLARAAGAVVERLEDRTLLSVFLAPRVDYGTGHAPKSVVSADFNSDGQPDLAAPNWLDNTVSVLMNNGNGTFATKVDYAVGNYPIAVAAGDLNGDGSMDLAVANYGDDTVSVLLNKGNGAFYPAVTYATGTHPWALAAADLNGDGALDLVAVDNSAGSVSVLMNNGLGVFSAKADYSTGASPVSVAIRDFNGDGEPDLAVACNDSSGTVNVLLNGGNGTFSAGASYTMGQSCSSIVSADFNGDGSMDLAVGEKAANAVGILLGNGNGTFAPKVDYATGRQPTALVVGDFDGNGSPDLATANWSDRTARLLLNNGNGTFSASGDYVTANEPIALAAADFNDDGLLDLAAADYNLDSISILTNVPNSTAVSFPDAHLEQAVRAALSKPSGTLTVGDMQSLTSLDAQNAGIANLTGLEYAVNLTSLDLDHNAITDITPLSGLTKLTSLSLASNQIGDLSALSGLTGLTSLGLWANLITDLSPLAGLTALTSLQVGDNSVSSLAPLAALTNLTTLSAAQNLPLASVAPLSGLTGLTSLDLSVCSISDVQDLGGLTSLLTLDLHSNQISDISPLLALTALQTLDVSYNNLDLTDGSSARTTLATLAGNGVTATFLPQNIEPPPTGVTATTNQTGKISLSWTPPLAADTYEIWRNTANDPATATVLIAGLTNASYDDTSAVAGTSYWYWIKARNIAATSGFSLAAQGLRVPLDLVAKTLSIDPTTVTCLAGGLLKATRSYQVNGTAPSFYIQYRLSTDNVWGNADDILLAPSELINQAAGQSNGLHSGAVSLAIPWSIRTGKYYLLAKLDATNLVAEDSESNNLIVSSGQITLIPPRNDSFSVRPTIVGAVATTYGSNTNATREELEPYHAGYTGGRSVWWTWTAPDSGRAQIDTLGSNFDTLLGVYTGSKVSSLVYVASNNNIAPGNPASAVTFNAVRGKAYQIAVDGYHGATGLIKLNIKLTPGVLDDAQAVYSPSSAWKVISGGYQGSLHYANPASLSAPATATWTFSNILPGTYRVSVTWTAGSNRASNAPFAIYNVATPLKTVLVNEKVSPLGTSYDGAAWQSLGAFTITGSSLSVRLFNNANFFVLADAVRIERIA